MAFFIFKNSNTLVQHELSKYAFKVAQYLLVKKLESPFNFCSLFNDMECWKPEGWKCPTLFFVGLEVCRHFFHKDENLPTML